MTALAELLRVTPGRPVDLAAIDPKGTPGLPRKQADKAWARQELIRIGVDLASLQEQLYAQARAGDGSRRVLLLLQAMDCGGKDGAIRQVAGAMNPQGLRIVSFGAPTKQELAHDFLWRIRRALPVAGEVGFFNRSHYEDVLVVRVHELVPAKIWRARYDTINSFERELVDSGTTLIKVMLHISYAEQGNRLAERLADPTKYWKYNPGDLAERRRWADYQEAYAEALTRCSTPVAPWYVLPADRKWYRDWALATLLRDALAGLDLSYPPPGFDVARERALLEATMKQ